MKQIYDMIVIGGGPAGYTAALYAARSGLSTLVLEKLSAGGQMALTEQIDNYPGFEDGIDGFTLGEKMQQSAERFGAVTELAEVYKASLSGRIKTLDTSEGVFQGRTVVIATGASPRPLGVPGEDTLIGKGVHYCAACDGAPYRGKTVAVVGGGNSAAADALALSRIAKEVYLIHRRDSLRATKVYHAPLMNAPNVEFCWNSTVSALLHESRLTGLRLKNVLTGEEHDLACDGVFISVGRAPATELFRNELALDKSGYIVADESTRNTGMLLFHLHEHLLRRGMPLKLRYGSQYLLCVFRHTANPPSYKNKSYSFAFIIPIFLSLSTATRVLRPQIAPKALTTQLYLL